MTDYALRPGEYVLTAGFLARDPRVRAALAAANVQHDR